MHLMRSSPRTHGGLVTASVGVREMQALKPGQRCPRGLAKMVMEVPGSGKSRRPWN